MKTYEAIKRKESIKGLNCGNCSKFWKPRNINNELQRCPNCKVVNTIKAE